ncbi:hypothetical protein [Halococcus hamelinensis]|uniref:hypothetical protein n=1 Tax=Halococcus hamelinensis TaxID=332168 RepID=UPI0012947559|nr:hypothetical protein [Halococcus hamelinensis]
MTRIPHERYVSDGMLTSGTPSDTHQGGHNHGSSVTGRGGMRADSVAVHLAQFVPTRTA